MKLPSNVSSMIKWLGNKSAHLGEMDGMCRHVGYKRNTVRVRGTAQTQALWEPGKHNARHGFLNRSRSIWTIISVAATCSRALARFTYVCAHLDDTYVYTYVSTYSACSSCPVPRTAYPPRSTGQWLAASTAPFRSTPLRTASRSLRPSPLAPPPPPLISTRCPSLRLLFYVLYNALPHLVRLFFPSFVRVTLAESSPVFRRLQCATAPLFSRLLSPSLSVSFRSSVPAPTRAGIPARSSLFRGSVPSLFQSGAFPRLTGIFGAAPFGYR